MASELEIRIKLAQEQAIREGQQLAQKLGQQLRGVKADVQINANDKDIKLAQKAIDALAKETIQAEQQAQKLKQAFNLNDDEVRKVTAEMKRLKGETGEAADKSKSLDGVLVGLASGAAFAAINAITGALQNLVSAIGGFVQSSLQASQTSIQLKTALTAVTGSAAEADAGLAFVRKTITEVGGDFSTAAKNYTQLAAAANSASIDQKIVNDLFAESARVFSVFGLGAGQADLAFSALSQILSKGTLSLEELRGQLGEQLPIAIGATVEGFNRVNEGADLTVKQFLDLVSTGKVTAEQFAVAFTAGLQDYSGSANAAVLATQSLENAVGKVQKEFGDAITPVQIAVEEFLAAIITATAKSTTGLDDLTSAATRLQIVLTQNPEIAERIGQALAKVASEGVEQLTKLLDAVTALASNKDSIDGFSEAIENTVAAIEAIGIATRFVVALAETFSALNKEREVLPGIEISLLALLSPTTLLQEGIAALSGAFEAAIDKLQSFAAEYSSAINFVIDSIPALKVAIDALNQLRGEAETPVTVQGGIADDTGDALSKAFENASKGVQGADLTQAKKPEVPELKDLTKEQDNAIQALENAALQEEAILRQQGASQEEIAAVEAELLQKRIASREEFLEKLKASGLSGVEFDKEVLDAEKEIAQDQIELAESKADAAEEAAQREADARAANRDDALAQIDLEQTQLTRDLVASGAGQEEIAEAERKFLQERIAALQEFANEARAAQVSPAEQIAADKAVADAELALARSVAAEREKIDRERLAELQKEQEKIFRDAQEAASEQFSDESRAEQKAFQEELQSDQEAFQKALQSDQDSFAEQQRAKEESFQKRQQAEAEAFNERQRAEQEQFSREQGVLTSEVDRRFQLETADSATQRADLEAQFAQEDEQAALRRDIEAQVLREQSSILNQRGDELELSPLEQAQKDFEAQQQEEAKAFEEEQRAEEQAFQESLREQELAYQEEQRALEEAFQDELEAREESFEEEQRAKEKAFQEEMQAAEEAFAEQQRQLDQSSAREIAAILDGTAASATPRRLGGGVEPGQLYQVGEAGPELFRRGGGYELLGLNGPELFRSDVAGQILSPETTAAMLTPSMVADLPLGNTGAMPNHRLESQLGRLIETLSKPQPGGDTITFVNESDPYAALERLQAAKLRNLVRSRR